MSREDTELEVLFFGGRTPGRLVLETIDDAVKVVGVVTNPTEDDRSHEAGEAHRWAEERGLPTTQARPGSPEFSSFVHSLDPDLLWITDYTSILPEEVLDLAEEGAVNLHPSLLPAYRGRAPVNWAIINAETELGLTAHFAEPSVDEGNIIHQERFPLNEDEDVADALDKLYDLYPTVAETVLGYFQAGDVPRKSQDEEEASRFGRRTPEDGAIDWDKPAEQIHNLIRAVTDPYPGAFTDLDGHRLRIWEAEVHDKSSTRPAGEILSIDDGTILVSCGEDALRVVDYDYEGDSKEISPGAQLETNRSG
jgi:methionyl-tRNA formyltransferase